MQEELVEGLAPGPGVQSGAVRENPVEVEQAGAREGMQAEHLGAHWDRREPRQRPHTTGLRHAHECVRGLLSLARELTTTLCELRRGKRAPRGAKGPLRGVERQLPV